MLSNNEQNERKSRIAALAGTILFHTLTLGVLLLLAFHTDFPLPPDEGVEINLDYKGTDTANPKPAVFQTTLNVEPKPDQKKADENMDTEMAEETHITKKKEFVKPSTPKNRISIVETPDESTLIHRTQNSGKNTRISTGGKQGITEKPGDQVNQNDIKSLPTNKSSSEKENGISFDLGGRVARILPRPTFNSSEDGKIVVSVKVNIEGKVISANAGAKGTTIAEPSLRKQAENAARISLFARDTNAPEEQRGTITYSIVKQK